MRPSLSHPGNQTSPLNPVGTTAKVFREVSIMATCSNQESAESTSNTIRPDASAAAGDSSSSEMVYFGGIVTFLSCLQ